MNDKSDLLGQLKINRGVTPAAHAPRLPWLLAAALLIIAVAAYALLRPAIALPV